MDSPKSPRIRGNAEEEGRENQDEQKEDLENSVEPDHQINENVLIWIKQFKVNFYYHNGIVVNSYY